jgi:hypothetical protein
MGWQIKFTNIRQPMLKIKTHSGFHDLFLSYPLPPPPPKKNTQPKTRQYPIFFFILFWISIVVLLLYKYQLILILVRFELCAQYIQSKLKGHLWDKEKWPYKIDDLLKEVQFIWNFLWQDKKNMTFKYRWLLYRGDCLIEVTA